MYSIDYASFITKIIKKMQKNMELKTFKPSYVSELSGWFSNEKELKIWSGPGFRFPFNEKSFREDLKLDSLHSFGLFDGDIFIAFGQFYNRLEHCHLGRIVVKPERRGQGISKDLLTQLCELGTKTLSTANCSLFVMTDNEPAKMAYEVLGFKVTRYPEKIPISNCLYMTK